MEILNIALVIEQSINTIDSINSGIRLTREEQDFFCEDISRDFFTQVAHSSNIYGKLNKSSVEKIRK